MKYILYYDKSKIWGASHDIFIYYINVKRYLGEIQSFKMQNELGGDFYI